MFLKIQEKAKVVRMELLSQKNDKLIKKNYAEIFINEMSSLLKDNMNIDIKKITKEIEDKQVDLNKIINDINDIELKMKKSEALFSKFLLLLN